jgi:hypothetical protein
MQVPAQVCPWHVWHVASQVLPPQVGPWHVAAQVLSWQVGLAQVLQVSHVPQVLAHVFGQVSYSSQVL